LFLLHPGPVLAAQLRARVASASASASASYTDKRPTTSPTNGISTSSSHPHSPKPSALAPIFNLLSDRVYVLTLIFGFIYCLGLFFPSFYIQLFASSHGIPDNLAIWSLSIMNLCGVAGRIIPNWVADRVGVFKVYMVCMYMAGTLCMVMPACKTPASLVVFCVLYGFFSGSLVSLYFPTFIELNPDPAQTGIRLGIGGFGCGLANLIGSPICGALVGRNYHWFYGTEFAGLAEVIAASVLTVAYQIQSKRRAAQGR